MITQKIEAIRDDMLGLEAAIQVIGNRRDSLLHKVAAITKLMDAATVIRDEEARFSNVQLVLHEIFSRIKIISKAEQVVSDYRPTGVDGCASVMNVENFLEDAFKRLGEYLIGLLAHDVYKEAWKGGELELTGNQAWALADLICNGSVIVEGDMPVENQKEDKAP